MTQEFIENRIKELTKQSKRQSGVEFNDTIAMIIGYETYLKSRFGK